MLIEEVRKLNPLDRFTYWILERESIRLKKDAGEPKPWTNDQILQSYRFCNVVRMDDKVSVWLLQNWYEPYFDHSNMIPAIALARFFNKPSSLEAIGFPKKWEPELMKETLRKVKLSGTVFNSAYMVRGNDGKDKVESVIDFNVQPFIDNPPVINRNSMEESHLVINSYYGIGSFMAGQIVADMRWAMKGEWDDRLVWAPCGPGSMRGMNRLKGRELKKSIPQKQFTEELQELILEVGDRLPDELVSRMEAQDFQNCLCEHDKQCRVLNGEGTPKQLYKGVS